MDSLNNETQFVFIDIKEFEQGHAIRGAALVTDNLTEPGEFRCTSVIRPTSLQWTLWGKRIHVHIASRLVGKPLLNALSNSAKLVIVRNPDFVELRTLIEIPLVQLLRHEELTMASPLTSADGDGGGDDVLESTGGRYEPIVLKVHQKYRDDREVARKMLAETFRLHNILEPFERIETAIDMIHQQEAGKSKE